MHTASDTGVISSYHHHENIRGRIIKTRSILPASSQVQYTRNEATSNQIYIYIYIYIHTHTYISEMLD